MNHSTRIVPMPGQPHAPNASFTSVPGHPPWPQSPDRLPRIQARDLLQYQDEFNRPRFSLLAPEDPASGHLSTRMAPMYLGSSLNPVPEWLRLQTPGLPQKPSGPHSPSVQSSSQEPRIMASPSARLNFVDPKSEVVPTGQIPWIHYP